MLLLRFCQTVQIFITNDQLTLIRVFPFKYE